MRRTMNVEVIRHAIRNRPFLPFVLRLADGRAIEIPHPELIALGSRYVNVINTTDDSVMWLEPLLIVSLDHYPESFPSAPPLANGEPPSGAPSGS